MVKNFSTKSIFATSSMSSIVIYVFNGDCTLGLKSVFCRNISDGSNY